MAIHALGRSREQNRETRRRKRVGEKIISSRGERGQNKSKERLENTDKKKKKLILMSCQVHRSPQDDSHVQMSSYPRSKRVTKSQAKRWTTAIHTT